MSVPSAAGVKFQGVGKFLVLNIRCFAVNVLCLDIFFCFCFNLMGNMRVYEKAWGIESQNVLYFGFHVVLKKKISINALKMHCLLLCKIFLWFVACLVLQQFWVKLLIKKICLSKNIYIFPVCPGWSRGVRKPWPG